MTGSWKITEEKLREIAVKQGGYFTANQASSAGYADSVHGYHLSNGDWERPVRGVYRLANLPIHNWPDLPIWSLWSRDREGSPQGVYSHETALQIHGIADRQSGPLHMTVPKAFRKNTEIPESLILHKIDLADHEIERKAGYTVTTLRRTFADLGLEFSERSDNYNDIINAGED